MTDELPRSVLPRSEARIRELSDKAFAEHLITPELDQGVFRSWLCKRQGSSTYWFRITTIPGSLILTGDLGSLVVTRERDMVPWCRGSVDSTHYFAEKCDSDKLKVFCPEVVKEWIAEQRAYLDEHEDSMDPEDLQLQREQLDEAEENVDDTDWRHLAEIVEDCIDPGDPPRWDDWDPQFLWRRDAVRWFVRNVLKTVKPAETADGGPGMAESSLATSGASRDES